MTPMNAGETATGLLFDTLTMNAGNWNMDGEIVTNMRNPAIGLMCDNALGEDVIDPLYSLENVDLWRICIGIPLQHHPYWAGQSADNNQGPDARHRR